jgi:hypothetical protein
VSVFEIPLQPQNQNQSISLSGAQYNLVVRWNQFSNCWIMDIYDVDDNPVLLNRPLVTGADLLAQFAYLMIGGQMIVQSDGVTNAVPTYNNLGSVGHLYYRIADAA